jgi:hypothetical protein
MRLDRWWTQVAASALAHGDAGQGDWPGPRAAVHHNNCREARITALAQIYRAVHRVVGPACFRTWALHYVETRPSAEVDLNHHGRDFPAWLRRSRASGLLGGLDYLPDLARLERAVNEAYYAADVPQTASTSEPAPDAILRVAPSLRTVASRYPVDEIWRVNVDGDDARQVVTEPGWRHIVIWRSINQVTVESVPTAVFRVLRQLARDPRFEVLADSGVDPGTAARLVARRWITGWETCIA